MYMLLARATFHRHIYFCIGRENTRFVRESQKVRGEILVDRISFFDYILVFII